ncbi:TLC domain [Trypanosoma vivax]|uniref:TLC domain-containing protein n=1 Tax=Trypanosoma vivax (strain Y486) TaxID=1055687 RepID=G0TZY4_TRYVY|nr:TLC domain [Trypanosoma vivax]KAH8617713.1 TLC domain [Trypanosoma vivax]CCC50164.1 conserved hypothetical protein [Trypanosoma vivax Y486]
MQFPLGDVYAMPLERAEEYGFVSYYNHTGDAATSRASNNLTLTDEEWRWLLTNPVGLAMRLAAAGGLGLDTSALPQLLPCLLWAVVFVLVRLAAQTWLSRIGVWLRLAVPRARHRGRGTVRCRRLRKFQIQLWLAVYYAASTAFGWAVQRDKPWFGFPASEDNRIALLTPHPYRPEPELLLYYQYGLGFYLSEMVALLAERDMRRADFLEYFVHHLVTFALVILSHCSYEHRFGAYVLFLHDASDIMLAVTRAFLYVVDAQRTVRVISTSGQ